ncbi:MAG TPA: homoserine kinase [Bacillota bacterium]|nr:homoserine kinase [Bacillota bacterium]
MFTIITPASSANLGPGFDSAGVAVNKYLTLQVTKQDKWEIIHDSPLLPSFLNVDEHFIYKVATDVAKQFNKQLPACKVVMQSDIPLARGLGSSASAVVAAIELANVLCDLQLTDNDRLKLATAIEGHPDNVAPAIFGGYIVSATLEHTIEYIKLPALAVDTVIYIPDVELKTSDSRNVLPKQFNNDAAASASSISNVMLAALLTNDFVTAGKMMENDMFHEPYRSSLIPNYDFIKSEAKKLGAYGTVISGAGPTMISFVPQNQGEDIAASMQKTLPTYDVTRLTIDNNGVVVKK